MQQILDFFELRHMMLNSLKTNFMVFKSSHSRMQFPPEIKLTDSLTIRRVTSFKYLGLYIDENLQWITHIKHLERKLAPANGILWKFRNVLPKDAKKLVYDTLFQSASYPRFGDLQNVQVLQNSALRNVYELESRSNRVSMYTHQAIFPYAESV